MLNNILMIVQTDGNISEETVKTTRSLRFKRCQMSANQILCHSSSESFNKLRLSDSC